MKQLGKRGRKTIRSVKRKRYDERFIHRYGMSRSEWVSFKKLARATNRGREIAEKMAKAYKMAMQ